MAIQSGVQHIEISSASLDSGAPAPVVTFGRGSGQVEVTDQANVGMYDGGQYRNNVLQLTGGLTPADLEYISADLDSGLLSLRVRGTDDMISIRSNAGVYLDFDAPVGRLTLNTLRPDQWVTVNEITGTDGADTLSGTRLFNDKIMAGAGDDLINLPTSYYSVDDVVVGGAGNDTIQAQHHITLQYSAGFGADELQLYQRATLQFDSTIKPDDVVVKPNEAGNYTIVIAGTADSINLGDSVLPEIEFSDGTRWSADQVFVRSQRTTVTEGDDYVRGAVAAVLNGLGGNDSLIGGQLNTTVIGGAGDDYLQSGAAHDVVLGGAGKDVLLYGDSMWGGAGADVYAGFSASGALITREVDPNAPEDGATDVIDLRIPSAPMGSYAPHYEYAQNAQILNGSNGQQDLVITLERIRYDSLGTHSEGSPFNVTVKDINNPTGPKYVIRVNDDAAYDVPTYLNWVQRLPVSLPAGPQVIEGTARGEVLKGGANADALYGLAGDDTLIATSGHDTLVGGQGNDTYELIQMAGAGTMEIVERPNEGSDDVLYASNYSPYGNTSAQGTFRLARVGDDLTLRAEQGGTALIKDFYAEDLALQSGLDAIVIGDGRYNRAALLVAGQSTNEADRIRLGQDAELIDAQGGNDVITNIGAGDVVLGGDGDDTFRGGGLRSKVYGEGGNDLIVMSADFNQGFGGQGNDTMIAETGGNLWGDGSAGDDTFIVRTGGSGYMAGGIGNDRYVLQDTLSSLSVYEADGGGTDDRIILAATASQLKVGQDEYGFGYKIYLEKPATGASPGELATLVNLDATTASNIESIELSDGTIWTVADLDRLSKQITPYADVIKGTSQSEAILALGGDDTILGLEGNDTLDAGDGDDRITDLIGANVITAGAGNDLVNTVALDYYSLGSGDGLSTVNGGDGNDTLLAALGDTLIGGAGDDWLTIQRGNAGSEGHVSVVKWGQGQGSDHLVAKEGNPYNTAPGAPADLIIELDASLKPSDLASRLFDVSRDGPSWMNPLTRTFLELRIKSTGETLTTAYAEGESPYARGVRFGPEGAVMTLSDLRVAIDPNAAVCLGSRADYDKLSGAGGNDTLTAWGLEAVISGGRGDDLLKSYGANSVLLGGDGNDTLLGGDGGRMDGGLGRDTMAVYVQGKVTVVAEDSDVISLNHGSNAYVARLSATDPNTVELTIDGDPARLVTLPNLGQWSGAEFRFNDGAVLTGRELLAQAGIPDPVSTIPTVQGTASADTLIGADASASRVLGLGGNDTLSGRVGINDTLNGGAGDDLYLVGNVAPTIQLDAGFGHDVVQSGTSSNQAPGAFTVKLASNYRAADAQLSLVNDDQFKPSRWVLSFAGSGDQIEFLGRSNFGPPTLSHQDLPGQIGSLTAMPDRIEFGDGAVWTHADILSRSLQAAQTGVFVAGTSGADTLVGASTGAHVYRGLGGNDTFKLGAGNSLALGGSGNDTYVLQQGWGTDASQHIAQSFGVAYGSPYMSMKVDSGAGPMLISDDGGLDVLKFADSTTAKDITLSYSGGNVLITHKDGRQITVDNVLTAYHKVSSQLIETLSFADGSSLDVAGWINGKLVGTAGADLLDGDEGNDTLLGMAGNDTLKGGFGDDWLEGGAGNDLLIDNGTYQLDPVIYGGSGEPRAAGADTFAFNVGFGQDTIVGSAMNDSDTLVFGPGIALADLRKAGLSAGPGVEISVNGTTDSVQINYGSMYGSSLAPITTVKFDGQAAMSFADFLNKVSDKITKPVNLTLNGTAGKDNLLGGAGDDTLTGLAGNDTLAGGLGNDKLIGGKGNDTYLFNRGDGRDTIVDADSTWFNADLLKVGNAKSSQLWLTKSGNNLDIGIIGTQDHVVIQDWYKGSANQVEKITALGDGKSLSASKVNALVTAMAKFAAPAEGVTTLPVATQTALTKILASSWA
jgi:Ca2+-binding RTX toxin-like protein